LIRTIPATAEEQSLKFSIKVINKTAASAAQFAKAFCFMLIHVQPQLAAAQAQTKTSYRLAYLSNLLNSSFGYKLRTG